MTLAGCAGNRSRDTLSEAGLQTRTVQGRPFRHVLFERLRDDGVLHVYLEGDGIPWVQGGRRIARDPGPHRSVVRGLMALDPASVLLLGRPCHHGMARRDPACHPLHWTFLRYGPDVLDSMEGVLLDRLAELPDGEQRRVVLAGHSGGGALAVLLAERLGARVAALVTLAAPLDTDAWTAHHGYTPLHGSRNPAAALSGLGELPRRHHYGSEDREVPPGLAPAPPEPVQVHPGFDHHCCWSRLWPGALQELLQRP